MPPASGRGSSARPLLWKALARLGWTPEREFKYYKSAELEQALRDLGQDPAALVAELRSEVEATKRAAEAAEPAIEDSWPPAPPAAAAPVSAPRSNAPNPAELPGQRQNLPPDVIRVDDQGRLWFQEEVRKPDYPKPRGRRVLKYIDPGTRTETVTNGEYVETFEVAGEGPGRPAEVKITLPSYQVGIYKDPRFPFRVHCYAGQEGFNLFEVQDYYGGAHLVPTTVKRRYIENELCYDIRTVVEAIQTEHRQLMLQKGAR